MCTFEFIYKLGKPLVLKSVNCCYETVNSLKMEVFLKIWSVLDAEHANWAPKPETIALEEQIDMRSDC